VFRKISVSKLRLIYYIVTADPPKLTPEIRTDNLLEIEFVRIIYARARAINQNMKLDYFESRDKDGEKNTVVW
jgi:hypothetical protein